MFNPYGDKIVSLGGEHGVDISSQRMDLLDHKCLEFATSLRAERSSCTAIDMGGGLGAQSLRLAHEGVNVTLIDLTIHDLFEPKVARRGCEGALRVIQQDFRTVRFRECFETINIFYSQRALGCVTYSEAKALITEIFSVMDPGGMAFVSVGGLLSELGKDYPGQAKQVDERWCELDRKVANKHEITSYQCLYTEEELRGLFEVCGATVVDSWTSEFGNPKIIASPRRRTGGF